MREKTRASLESRMGTVKLFLTLKSWSWPLPLTAWLPVGCRPRAFPADLIHPSVSGNLFCFQVWKHLLSLRFMFAWVERRAGYPGGRMEIEEVPGSALYLPTLSVGKKGTPELGFVWNDQKATVLELCCNWGNGTKISFRDRPGLTSPLRALTSCVAFVRVLDLSELGFLHLSNRGNDISLVDLSWELNELA